MSDMRDKIAGVKYMGTTVGHGVADAIIAALPDMVKPLEWSDIKWNNLYSTSGVYKIILNEKVGKYYINFGGMIIRDKSGVTIYHKTLEAAIAAANDHHVKQVMESLGVQS